MNQKSNLEMSQAELIEYILAEIADAKKVGVDRF